MGSSADLLEDGEIAQAPPRLKRAARQFRGSRRLVRQAKAALRQKIGKKQETPVQSLLNAFKLNTNGQPQAQDGLAPRAARERIGPADGGSGKGRRGWKRLRDRANTGRQGNGFAIHSAHKNAY